MNCLLSIIIVEDDPITAHVTHKIVESLGFHVAHVCSDAGSALEKVHTQPIHIAILDIDLEGKMDGIQLAKELQKYYKIIILFISAYSEQEIINEALSLMPIAYLVKPVKKEDLAAALQLSYYHHLHNNTAHGHEQWILLTSVFRYNKANKQLFRNSYPVELTPLEKKLLSLLIDHNGQCVSYDQILRTLWNHSDSTVDSLRSLIRRLHQKLDHTLIYNVYAKGYRITTIHFAPTSL